MALTPIGDIANNTFTQVASINWSTATDWDNAVDTNGVAHESTADTDFGDAATVQMGISPSYKSSPFAQYPLDEDTGSTVNDVSGNGEDGTNQGANQGVSGHAGTTAYSFDADNSEYVDTPVLNVTGDQVTVAAMINPTYYSKFSDKSYSRLVYLGEDYRPVGLVPYVHNSSDWEPYFEVQAGGSRATSGEPFLSQNASYNFDEWFTLVGRYDGSTVECWVNGSQENSASQSGNIDTSYYDDGGFIGTRGGSSEYFGGIAENIIVESRAWSDSEIQAYHDALTGGYLETSTKSFSGSETPNFQNLTYSLNGQTIDLKAIGSPGTASEEVVTQTLDGSSSYSLTWSNAHTDFRLRIEFSTTDPTVTPTFGEGELVA